MRSATIGEIYGRTIGISDMIARVDAMTAETCGGIWAAEATAAAKHSLEITEPTEASTSVGSYL